jgi:hypothetical protein
VLPVPVKGLLRNLVAVSGPTPLDE